MFSVFARSDNQEVPKRIPLPAIGGEGDITCFCPVRQSGRT